MRNFKQLVWEDEGKPLEGETVLVCFRDTTGALDYCLARWEAGEWLEHRECVTIKNVEAWAYIPQCAFIYPYRRLNNE